MVRRSRRRPAFRVLAYSTAAALVAVGLTSVAAAADPEPAGPATSTSTGTATTPPVAASTTSPTDHAADDRPDDRPDAAAEHVTDPDDLDDRQRGPLDTADVDLAVDAQPGPGSRAGGRRPDRRPVRGTGRSHGGARPHRRRPRRRRGRPGTGIRARAHQLVGTDRRLGDLTAVDARFQTISGPAGRSGFPSTAPMGIARGQSAVVPSDGVLWWSSATGAWETVGSTNDRYLAISGIRSCWASRPAAAGRSPAALAVVHRRRDLVQPADGGVGDPRRDQLPVPRDRRSVGRSDSRPGRELDRRRASGSGSSAASIWWSPRRGVGDPRRDQRRSTSRWVRAAELVRVPDWRASTPTTAGSGRTSGTGQPPVGRPARPRRDLRRGQPATCGHPGAPAVRSGRQSLTLIRLNYWGFDNAVHRGEIIVRSDLAGRVATVFGAALAEHYPIRTDVAGGLLRRRRPRVDGRRQHVGLQLPPGDRVGAVSRRTPTASQSISTPWKTPTMPADGGGPRRVRRPQQRAVGDALRLARK